MPSTKPCAAFEPISPNFDVAGLVESTPNFEYVVRIHCDMIDHQGIENFQKLVLLHVILGGKPLVIEGYQERLDRWTFALQWLRDNCASKIENARDLTKKTNLPLSIGHYLNNMALLTNQWNRTNYKDINRQRIYLKDIDCPQLWHDKLQDLIPLGLFYLNETTGDPGGIGAVDEPNPTRPGTIKGRGISKAGDLMSSLPPEMRAENLMCYIGHEGTYTPAHREMCASLGQNIMVETSTGAMEDGKLSKPGSSIWFMTETKEREVVSEYWLSTLGHDIEVENHFAQINAWKAAPFKTYVVEQRLGDFILIPPLAPHQVWNRGTRTMKVAWNRTTVETLEMALNEALPHARMVCRDEQYKNKAIVYYSLMKYSRLLKIAEKQKQKQKKHKQSEDAKIRQLQKDFRRLLGLFTQIMISESFDPRQEEKNVELVPFDSNITCSYCRCNIFNRFLTCPSCVGELVNGDKDTYDVCMECYAMGRSCACISKLRWVEQFPWGDLIQNHELWKLQVIQFEGEITQKLPQSLKKEIEKLDKKRTLAQICQDELVKRPWRDITKPETPVEGDEREEEVDVDANGRVKKKRKIRRSEKFTRDHKACHVDKHWEPKWKQAQCSKCGDSFCYGTLFRGYDMMPQDIMANPGWQCPKCLNMCNCRDCNKKPGFKPYVPSGTRLGHNTKIVADPRSVESLVDFSYSNLAWIQKAGDDHSYETSRLKKRIKAADKAKAKGAELGEDYVEENATQIGEVEDSLLRLAQHEGIPIDPSLMSAKTAQPADQDSQDDEERYNENPEEFAPRLEFGPQLQLAPQYVVPAGGIIRDKAHVYDVTEAITYDYPDLDSVPARTNQPETESVTDGPPPGYEPAVPTSPGQIAMTHRKRKRAKLDDGDRSYNIHRTLKTKPKKQQTLLVKLVVGKEKLAEIKRSSIIAQRVLEAVENAPVISSDLQALNAEWAASEGPRPHKKAPIEPLVEEEDQDDDFTPGRKRDRRRSGQGGPPVESEPTRRITRIQAVTSDEDSNDDDDNDDVDAKATSGENDAKESLNKVSSPPTTSNSRGMEVKNPERPTMEAITTDGTTDMVPIRSTKSPGTTRSVQSVSQNLPSQRSLLSMAAVSKNGAISQTAKPVNRMSLPASNPPKSQIPAKDISKTMAEAQANRKAKLNALKWIEGGDASSGSEASSDSQDGSDISEVMSEPQPKQTVVRGKRPILSLAPSQGRGMTETVQTAAANEWSD